MAKRRAEAIANLIVEMLVIINLVLTVMGKSPIPFDDQKTLEALSYLLTGLQTLRIWYYNQDLTIEGESGTALTREMKANKGEVGGEGDALAGPEDCEDGENE